MSNFTRLNGITKPSKTVVDRCVRCGGSGHYSHGACYRCGGCGTDPTRRDYGFPSYWSDEQCESWLNRKAALSDARRQAKNPKRLATEEALFAENLAACPALSAFHEFVWFDADSTPKDQWPVLNRRVTQWEATFIRDTVSKARRYALSEKQIAVCNSIIERANERAAKAAAEAETAVNAPSGRCEIEGEVVSIKEYDGDYGHVVKILVACEGYKCFGTAPRSIVEEVKRGYRVSLTATLQPKERGFAIFSRPAKATLTVSS